jgi:hypothetical protein
MTIKATEKAQQEAGVRATFTLYSVLVDISHDVRGMDKEEDEIYHRRAWPNTASAAPTRRLVILWLSSFTRKLYVYSLRAYPGPYAFTT